MTAREVRYRLEIFNVAVSQIEFRFFEITQAPPIVRGQLLTLPTLRLEGLSTTIILTDRAQKFTKILSTAPDDRMNKLNRIARLQMEIADSGMWTTLITGRLSVITPQSDHASYLLQIDDERIIEQQATLWETTDTIQLMPTGTTGGYNIGNFERPSLIDIRLFNFVNPGGLLGAGARKAKGRSLATVINRSTIEGTVLLRIHDPVIVEAVFDYIDSDWDEAPFDNGATGGTRSGEKPGFKTIRCFVDGDEREMIGVGTPTEDIRAIEDVRERYLDVWVSDSRFTTTSTNWNVSLPLGAALFFDLRLILVGAKTSDMTPLHLGMSLASHPYGTTDGKIHPFSLIRQEYTDLGVRFNSAAMQALEDDQSYGLVSFRITKSWNARRFNDTQIYQKFMVAPFVNDDGEIAPRSIRLPNTFNPNTAFDFTSYILTEHPRWVHSLDQLVNQITVKYNQERRLIAVNEEDTTSLDVLKLIEKEETTDHDNIAAMGKHHLDFGTFHGVHTQHEFNAQYLRFVHEMFQRFGDGPMIGRFSSTYDADSVIAGDFAIISLDTFENPAIQARGGRRAVQLTRKIKHFDHIEWEFLDAGPDAQPLTTPTVSLTLDATRPRHIVNVTVSAIDFPGLVLVQYAVNATEPPAASPLWRPVGLPQIATGASVGPFDIGPLPSGSVIWVRAQVIRGLRFGSLFSTAQTVTMTALAVPTAGGSSVLNGREALMTWTPAEFYPQQTLLDVSALPGNPVAFGPLLGSGANRYKLRGLDISTTHVFAVRHVDAYGGVSPMLKIEFTTTAVVPVCPPLRFLGVLVG